MKNIRYTATILMCSMLVNACGGERKNDPIKVSEGSIRKAITEFTDQTLIPDLNNFLQQAETLDEKGSQFCSDTNSTTLAAVQQQWYATSKAWYRILPYNFGPANDDLLDPRYRYIDYFRERGRDRTGTVRTLLAEFLAANTTFSDEFTLAYEVGLMPLELALFETSATQSTGSTEIINEYAGNSRKCVILNGLTQRLVADARYLQQGWEEDHLGSGTPFRDIFVNNEQEDGSQAIDTLLVSVQEFLDYIPKRDVISAAHPVAGGGWDNVSSSINAISKLLKGTDGTVVSIFSLMEAAGEDVAVNTVEGTLIQARLHIGQQDATSFYTDSATLDGYFKREIPDSLDVSLGINFTDGD